MIFEKSSCLLWRPLLLGWRPSLLLSLHVLFGSLPKFLTFQTPLHWGRFLVSFGHWGHPLQTVQRLKCGEWKWLNKSYRSQRLHQKEHLCMPYCCMRVAFFELEQEGCAWLDSHTSLLLRLPNKPVPWSMARTMDGAVSLTSTLQRQHTKTWHQWKHLLQDN